MTEGDADEDRISRVDAAMVLGVSLATVDRYAFAGHLDRRRNPITRRVTFSAHKVEELRQIRQDAP